MYTEQISKMYGIDQFTLEEFIRQKKIKYKSSFFGKMEVSNAEVGLIVGSLLGKFENEPFASMLKESSLGESLQVYYQIVKSLFAKGVLYVVQDFLVSGMDDYYDLTSYKFDLIVPIYDGYGRIMREGVLFSQEHVLFVAYSTKTKDGIEEKNNGLIHVFNGDNGGFAYIERDEKNIYEKKMSEMVDKNGKNIIEVLTSLLEPDATANLINKAQAELTQQVKNEQAQATGEAIGASIGAAILGASAANLGRSVRQLGRSI